MQQEVYLFVLIVCVGVVYCQGIPLPPTPPFNCENYYVEDLPYPNDVNKLRPHDIRVVMAMGDSMTAGFAMHATHVTDLPEGVVRLVEYRGDVYSIGGNSMQYTLANFLKLYNPSLQGSSIGWTEPLDVINPSFLDAEKARLNAAISGAKVEDLPGQVDYLVNQLQTTYANSVNYNHDWKMLTILIGANNLCIACDPGKSNTSPDFYEQQLNQTINQLYQQVPRLFINLLPMFNISQVYYWVQTSEYCKRMWNTLSTNECPCLTDDSTEQDRETINDYAAEYRQRVHDIADYWSSLGLTEFKVVVQPFTERLLILNLDFLSEADCFHPSWISDQIMAMGLWNNLLTPPSEKATNVSLTITPLCPTRDTYLQ